MNGWFSDMMRRSTLKRFYIPIGFLKSTINFAALWNFPRDRTFPYDPDNHSYIGSENDIVTCGPMTLLSEMSGIQSNAASVYDDQFSGIASKIINHESINYRDMP